MKQMAVMIVLGCMLISGCGKTSAVATEENQEMDKTIEGDVLISTEDETVDAATENQFTEENNAETAEKSAGKLLDEFIDGTVAAHSMTGSEFYITDLDMGSEEWDAYSVGDREDLDNDGEEELILSGPYGGKYLDARDGEVYEFAAGDGTAVNLSYTYYQGFVWIMYSNEMNSDYKAYHMERYDGADHKVNELDFSEEAKDENDPETNMIYTINNEEVSSEAYDEMCSKIFAAQMNTN